MIGSWRILRLLKSLWLSQWPLWTFLAFVSLAAVRLLPGGNARTVVAAPILLMVPGALTLGAVFSERYRPQRLIFVCYAILLSAAWSAFASLAIYATGKLITANSTYWCLLAVSAALAVVAEMRLLLERPGKGRRVARKLKAPDPDQADLADTDADVPTVARGSGYYSFIAVVAGVSLVMGGLFAYDHLPHPAPVGYTWMAWTGPPITGNITTSSVGTQLGFQVIHHQPDSADFRLSAAWLGKTSTPLAKPLNFSIGPNQTFRGTLFVPPLPDGCVHRIVVELTAIRLIDPLTQKPETWSINADVRDPSKRLKTCK